MERESFENADIGKLMNEHFVNIKVDREERPDVDKMYMSFVQAISGSGGWPMSVFLTPDLKPITGGTYFPPQDRFGRPGFPSILKLISKQWRDKRDGVIEQSDMLLNALKSGSDGCAMDSLPNESCIAKCYQLLKQSYEQVYGGFSKAPKFPQPVNMDFLLRYYSSAKDNKALDMVKHTLKCMADGGIHDHVAQGFHRYSTDAKWHVPHFEKMLYDQAQLAVAYSEVFNITKDPTYSDIVHDILTYVDRDLGSPSGGLYSAEDADSLHKHGDTEKKEGAFCVWTREELEKLLDIPVEGSHSKLSQIFCQYFNVSQDGNVDPRSDPHGELKNQNVLFINENISEFAVKMKLSKEKVKESLELAKNILFEARLKRPKPHLDDKMIAAWNGLMLSGYANAASSLGSQEYADRATKIVQFLQKHLTGPQPGTLLRSCYSDNSNNVTQIAVPIGGFADDYAFVIQGLLDLYEVNFDDSLLEWALKLQQTMDELFWDPHDGGYFLNPENDPNILIRMKEDQDGAEPGANSVASLNLARLSCILQDEKMKERAANVIKAFSARIDKIPLILPKMLIAYMFITKPTTNIILSGDFDSAEMSSLINCLNSKFIPFKSVVYISDKKGLWLSKQSDFYKQFAKTYKASAFLCKDNSCSLPVHTAKELMKLIAE